MKKTIVNAASQYDYCDDLCIITAFFNPSGFKSKKKNFDKFIAPVQSAKLNHIIVECTFRNSPYEIPAAENVIHVNSNAVLWQKERLLNIALKHVPEKCTKIVWIDCDILFNDSSWTTLTSALLEAYAIIQPYDHIIRLPKNDNSFKGEGLIYNSFTKIYNQHPNALLSGNFELHGHTGFAWAARKEVFEGLGFYDACLSGVADHLMAHAFCGDWHSPCLKKMFLTNDRYFAHFEAWSKKIYERVKGSVGYAKGTILHLWHGNQANRNYLGNSQFLSQSSFNPATDLFVNDASCLELNTNRELLQEWTQDYFNNRHED